tara:strand:- start:66 stop:254 length:189 start_codon:yes stop_codon:yes gene_type:complete
MARMGKEREYEYRNEREMERRRQEQMERRGKGREARKDRWHGERWTCSLYFIACSLRHWSWW